MQAVDDEPNQADLRTSTKLTKRLQEIRSSARGSEQSQSDVTGQDTEQAAADAC